MKALFEFSGVDSRSWLHDISYCRWCLWNMTRTTVAHMQRRASGPGGFWVLTVYIVTVLQSVYTFVVIQAMFALFIHTFLKNFLILWRRVGGWSRSQLTLDKTWSPPWMSCQSVAVEQPFKPCLWTVGVANAYMGGNMQTTAPPCNFSDMEEASWASPTKGAN